MFAEFRKFLQSTNALALAVGVIIGGAVGKVVSSLVGDILMPVIGLLLPGGAWRDLKVVLTTRPDGSPANVVAYGSFLGSVVDFAIVGFVVFAITKSLLEPTRGAKAPPAKECPECKETIPMAARRCRMCGSAVPV
jgi:large conductance mechanosensitive channel